MYFCVGGAGGLATLYAPEASVGIYGAVSALNSIINQGYSSGEWDWGSVDPLKVATSTVLGMVTSSVGNYLSSSFSNSFLLSWTKDIPGRALSSMVNHSLSNAASGFIVGTTYGLLTTGNLDYSLHNGVMSAISGAASGAVFGMAEGLISAHANNENPWTGKINNNSKNGDYSVYLGIDQQTGELKYVGITKRTPSIRWNEHLLSRTERATLEFRVFDSGYTRFEARIVEQFLINQYGLSNLYNRINSIAPKYWDNYNL